MADQKDNAHDFKVQTAKHSNMSTASMRPPSEQSRDRASKRLSSESNGNNEGGVGASTPVELTALEESFRRFAIHGDTRATGKEMHGKNWSKLCKDCNVIDGKSITLTDVDIVFTKVKNNQRSGCDPGGSRRVLPDLPQPYSVIRLYASSSWLNAENKDYSARQLQDCGYKPVINCPLLEEQTVKKSCRNITFDEFKAALGELAKKKYKEKPAEEAEAEVFKLIEGKAPVISGVTRAVASPTVSRLTDTSKFTGSHKERFDNSGRGKGKAGRVDVVDTSGYVSGYKHAGSYEKKLAKPM